MKSWRDFRPSCAVVLGELDKRNRTEVMSSLLGARPEDIHYFRPGGGGVVAAVRQSPAPIDGLGRRDLQDGRQIRPRQVGREPQRGEKGAYSTQNPAEEEEDISWPTDDGGLDELDAYLRPYPKFAWLQQGNRKIGGRTVRDLKWVLRLIGEIYDSKELAEASTARQMEIVGESTAWVLPSCFPDFVHEHLRKRHGIGSVVKKTCTTLLYTVNFYRAHSSDVEIFARFLEEHYGYIELKALLRMREAIRSLTKKKNLWDVSQRKEWLSCDVAIRVVGMVTDSGDFDDNFRRNLLSTVEENMQDGGIRTSQLIYLSIICVAARDEGHFFPNTTKYSHLDSAQDRGFGEEIYSPPLTQKKPVLHDVDPVSEQQKHVDDSLPDTEGNSYSHHPLFSPCESMRRTSSSAQHSPAARNKVSDHHSKRSWLTGELYSPVSIHSPSRKDENTICGEILSCLEQWELDYITLLFPSAIAEGTTTAPLPDFTDMLQKLRNETARVLGPKLVDLNAISGGPESHLLGEAVAATLKPLKDAIEASRPAHATVLMNMGRILEKEKAAIESALMCYKEASTVNPDLVDALFAEAYALHRMYKLEEADASYARLLERDPEHAKGWYNWGCLRHYDLHDDDGGIERLAEALRINPKDTASFVHLGNIFKDRGDADAAYDWYHKALASQDKSSMEARFNLALLMREQGRRGEAIRWLREVTEMDPTFGPAFHHLGVELWAHGQIEPAQRNLLKALELNPSNEETIAALAALREEGSN